MRFGAGELTPDRSARHFYGAELRRFRENADMSLAKLAGEVPCSKGQLARIETGESMAPTGLSEEFDRVFRADGHFTRLFALVCREVHPDQYKQYMSLEERAAFIQYYAGHVVWGLLQTEAYARAFFGYDEAATAEQIEELVAARLSRQERLKSAQPPYVWAILDEAVLRRPVGGPEVMREQLARLLPLVDTNRSKIQVLPFAHGGHFLMSGSTTLLRQPDGATAVWQEGHQSGRLYEENGQVIRRQNHYDALRAYALSPRESAALIRQLMEEYES